MKDRFFGGAGVSLHASELQNPTGAQLAALGEYFKTYHFGRLAALLSITTTLDNRLVPYQVAARAILERVARLAGRFGCQGVVLVFEESQRADHLAFQHFDRHNLHDLADPVPRSLEFLKFRMPKSAGEPLLEVADFVINAAGGQVRSHLKGHEWGARRDFQTVFRSVPPELAEFIDMMDVRID